MSDQASETPLLELLRAVPEDARAWYEHGSTSHTHIPYGLHCQRAADRISELEAKLEALEKGITAVKEELSMQINYDAPVSASCAKRCIDALAKLLEVDDV